MTHVRPKDDGATVTTPGENPAGTPPHPLDALLVG